MSEAWETEERDEHGRWSGGGAAWSNSDQIPPNTQPDLNYYTGEGSIAVNTFLRNPQKYTPALDDYKLEMEQTVSHIDQAIAAQPPTTQDSILFHGVSGAAPVTQAWQSLEPGGIINEPAYLSTSLDASTAQEFGVAPNDVTGRPPGTLLEIHAPAGTQGLNTNSLAIQRGEGEIILPHGSSMEVTGHSIVQATNMLGKPYEQHIVHVNLIPQR